MIQREETIGDCRLILGDCRDVLPMLGRFDAVITDPPYGIGRGNGMGLGGNCLAQKRRYPGEWDEGRPCSETIKAVLDAAPLHIVWGGNYLSDLLPVGERWIAWDKINYMPSYSDLELAWTSMPGTNLKKFTYAGSGFLAKEKDRFHPTQKPVELMKWCLGFVPDAQTILDPFMGSGSTLVACAKLGRAGVGVEMDPGFFDIACNRVRAAYDQPDLFAPAPVQPVQEGLDLSGGDEVK